MTDLVDQNKPTAPVVSKVEEKKVEEKKLETLHHVDQDLQKQIDILREIATLAKKKDITFAEAKVIYESYSYQNKLIEDARNKKAVGDYYAAIKKAGK